MTYDPTVLTHAHRKIDVRCRHVPLVALGCSVMLLASFARPSVAHRDDYIDETFVYQTLAAREFEVELWGERRREAGGWQTWNTTAFEYGATSRWTVDGAAQWIAAPGAARLGRLRFETRYRFSEEGRHALDLATSAEFEEETATVTGGRTETTLTPRLVVSRDIVPEVNTTLNLDVPIELRTGEVSFGYAVGVRYPSETFLRVGLELKHANSRAATTLFPQLWLAFPHDITVKLGTGVRPSRPFDPDIVRGVLEAEF